MSEVSVNNSETIEESAPAAAPSLNLQDIVSLLNIIDLATRRGAFRAEEMSSIGAVFDKVGAFLKSTGTVEETAEQDDARSE